MSTPTPNYICFVPGKGFAVYNSDHGTFSYTQDPKGGAEADKASWCDVVVDEDHVLLPAESYVARVEGELATTKEQLAVAVKEINSLQAADGNRDELIARLMRERDDARRACAEKDAVLRQCRPQVKEEGSHEDYLDVAIDEALSPTCGNGYMAPGEVEEVKRKAKVEGLRRAESIFRNWAASSSVGDCCRFHADDAASRIREEAQELESSTPDTRL